MNKVCLHAAYKQREEKKIIYFFGTGRGSCTNVVSVMIVNTQSLAE